MVESFLIHTRTCVTDGKRYELALYKRGAPCAAVIFEADDSCFDGNFAYSWIHVASIDARVGRDVLVPAKQLMISIVWDVTEQKKAEEERKKLQAQLTQAQKLESVGRLAGGVAHDFNNMLGVILGHSEMALEQIGATHPLFPGLTVIREAALRSADLTRQLLAFARRQTISPKILDLNEAAEGMLKMLRRLIGEDTDLAWFPAKGLWPVKVDPSQIDQILANLCVNARDAISGVGKITIETGNTASRKTPAPGAPGL